MSTVERTTDRRLYEAAVQLFAERGYHGTSIREIIGRVGVQPAAFYYHFVSKEDLLKQIMVATLEELTAEVRQAVAAERTAEARLVAALGAHVAFHAQRPLEAFVVDSELRGLDSSERAMVVELRDRYEAIFYEILDDGVRRGEFHVSDVKVQTYALMALATSVASWYSPGGRLGVDDVATLYTSLVLDGIRAR